MEADQNPNAGLPLYMAYLRGLAPELMTLIGADTNMSLMRCKLVSLSGSEFFQILEEIIVYARG